MKDVINVNYLDELGSTKPIPGGGSACCNVGIIASFLILKSLNITKARKSFEKKDANEKRIIEYAISFFSGLKIKLEKLEDKDIECFNKFMEAYKAKSKVKTKNSLIKCYESAYVIYNQFHDAFMLGNEVNLHIVDSIKSDYYYGMNLLGECMENAIDNMKENAKLLNNKDYNENIIKIEDHMKDINYLRRFFKVKL